MEIDVLIIKKEKDIPIRKNIGRLFRKNNIVEYKSPNDYLSIDDFYKVYGYACFYKSDTVKANEILAEDLTITMICTKYPKKLMGYLKEERKLKVEEIENGIYYIVGDYFPMQIIVTSRLLEEYNLWLKNLTNKLEDSKSAQKLLTEYQKHKKNQLYQSAMELIVRANTKTFQEVKGMCEALVELMQDEIDAAREEGRVAGIEVGRVTAKKEAARSLAGMGMPVEKIAEAVKMDMKEVQKWIDAS